MTTFWILAALLTLLALAFVMPSLLRKQNLEPIGEDAQRKANISLYKERLSELDNAAEKAQTELERNALTEQKNELQRRLLHELDRPETLSQRRSHPVVVWTLVLLLPVFAIFLYQEIGSPQAFEQQAAHGNSAGNMGGSQRTAPSMDEMILKLEQRLAEKPDDAEGWMMLGRAYQMMDKQAEASKAYKKSIDRNPLADANLLVAYAESLALSRDADLSGEPSEMLARALKLEPKNVNALWLSGVAAYKAEDFDQAVVLWRKARDNAPPGSEEYQTLAAQVAKLEMRLGQHTPADAVANTNTAVSPVTAATTATTDNNSETKAVHVSVSISPEMQAKMNPEHTLFVYAQALQGPKMPLAIVRKQAKDLPVQVSLDSSMAMMPTMSLDKFDEVVLLARISASGQAMPESGDLIGQSPPVRWKELDAVVEVIINQQR